MAAICPPGLKRFKDVGALLFTAFLWRKPWGILVHPVWEFGFKPIPSLRADPQIAARLSIYPGRHVDPPVDLVQTLPVPGNILAQMPVALGRIVSEPLQDIYAHLLRDGKGRM